MSRGAGRVELEIDSVLTRLPAPFRVEGELAADYLRRRHPGARLVLPAAGHARLITRRAEPHPSPACDTTPATSCHQARPAAVLAR